MVQSLGYLSSEYAESLAEFGEPRLLERSGGWILVRDIPGTPHRDATGTYPLFCCERDTYDALAADIKDQEDLVSLVVVADSMMSNSVLGAFNRCKVFKEHYVVDAGRAYIPSKHHKRYVKKALDSGVRIALTTSPDAWTQAWISLYGNLIERHAITGIQAFSPESFAKQFKVPGLSIFIAEYEDQAVSMLLFYAQGDKAYYHLGASSDLGYELKASFALMDFAIRALREYTVVLGGASGLKDTRDGLAMFKAGWANDTRNAWLCEAILQPDVYGQLAVGHDAKYYPVYRGVECKTL